MIAGRVRAAEESQDIASTVKRILREQLHVAEDRVQSEASLVEDLGADCLSIGELLLAFEVAFEIDIPDEALDEICTVQDAVDYMEQHARQ